MQKISAAVVVIAAAGTAWASPVLGDYSTYTQISSDYVSAVAMDDTATHTDRGTTALFSNMDTGPNGYVAFPAALGVLGADDYVSTSAGAFALDTYRFVGGNGVGGDMIVEFYNAAGDTLVNAFSVALGAGNFIYTITLGNGFMVDGAGIVQMVSDDLVGGGQWFLGDAGALALLGMGGLVATRRRR
jgi:hypothetical protein